MKFPVFVILFVSLTSYAQQPVCEDRILVAGIGDILVHEAQQIEAHKSPEKFHVLWKSLVPYISAADVAYGNLESPVAMGITPKGKDLGDVGFRYDKRIYSGTDMRFNFHPQIIGDLQKLGLDIVSTANNHSLDRLSIGIDRTILELQKQNMPFTGTRLSNGQGDWGLISEVKGKKIFWLSCTESLNGHEDKFNQVLKCYDDEKEITEIVRNAANDYDAVILLPHWGQEYSQSPNRQQKQWAYKMANLGVTAIIGNHPHVMQPIERIGSMVVAYSLGNFVAWQKGTPRKTSVILFLDLQAARNGKLFVKQFKGLPIYRVGQINYPAVNGLGSEALNYVSKHVSRENIVWGKDFAEITSCQ